ncbi:hypothetical protein C8A01DRAFT_42023 [Parachaetomium inaequale]|uniref:Uncharacterized protein n=1 Tax=Parachaetomium inaequale TaxID=2588326 RepID=A0AAN6P4E7_9PEZI|nr:hypothetical protein C8A01DRAFT_42023 [Parachaetomium inaequale]
MASTAGSPSSSTSNNNTARRNYARAVYNNPYIIARNNAILNYTYLYNNSSPYQSTTPSAFVFARIALPYAHNRKIESIGDSRPSYTTIVINRRAISRTRSKWLRACRRASASLSPAAYRRR